MNILNILNVKNDDRIHTDDYFVETRNKSNPFKSFCIKKYLPEGATNKKSGGTLRSNNNNIARPLPFFFFLRKRPSDVPKGSSDF